ncbi:MAG TPA: ABC transporter ATP-binding protein [Microthrixaceae bacterium]|nr:ABC transporter ATP-binding protein [Microthrixaceae bacterium]MCC6183249.1 ABC transporter ATP-binding protein [Microthrixaceae bacterium]MCO5306219.1 ABC transporter ATP-binding protein [Microthrixaceae bacterium]HMU79927.1 ABC transporter ATP-binding protein [Microthrixaceae bacterium]HMV74232.1 ABC transporter ATP-binding protein [Microthrixaceae bacterium]
MSLLEVRGLRAGYGIVEVLFGLDLDVDAGELVVVLGANGSGKTTTLRAVSGMLESRGEIVFDGRSLRGLRPDQVVQAGIAHVPQGRGTINDLTVVENLRIGAWTRRDSEVAADIDLWCDAFPRLGERRDQLAGSMSGGEQQMLAIARAFMSRPRLLLLDEPSLGLAPLVTAEVFDRLRDITDRTGTAVLLVEQNANLALDFAGRAYVLEAGEIVASGPAAQLQHDETVQKAYLGI